MAFLETRDKVNLYYETSGSKDPIVFIHGWSASSDIFLPQLKDLSKTNQVVIYDLRGHGRSDRTNEGIFK